MKKLLSILSVGILILTSAASAATSWDYGWEDGGTNFGSWDFPVTQNSTDQAHSGTHSLKITRGPNRPDTYIWWVNGLQNGDTVTASMWVQTSTGTNESPRGRIWAGYARNNDFSDYAGSASGNENYAGTPSWEQISHTWTFDAGDPVRDAMVIKARVYDNDGDFIYIDNTEITVSRDTAEIMNAAGDMIPEPAVALILLPFLALFRPKYRG